jgi:hypothetical protein
VLEMIQVAERPWRLLLRVSPPPVRQNAASASLGGELGQRNAGTDETPGLSTQRSRSFPSLIGPLIAPLATRESQRPLESTLSQSTLGTDVRQEVSLAQLTGASIEFGTSRRGQRRRSSALSAASSVARHYRPLDDGMEVAQDGL